ncbi:MAG TPA: DUF116 domain-containing protein, partial [Anaeromyxobacter sp.]|nr:DUF116 domain-containing protein [Anaeromyxobacter sp.]
MTANAPTYSLRPSGAPPELYLRRVARLADQVLETGAALRPVLDAYGAYVEETGREPRRSEAEYLVEALTLGVLWRARGTEATRREGAVRRLVDALAARRRAGGPRVRDGSNSLVLSLDAPYEPGSPAPTLRDLERLLTWLVASGEYDDEVARLEGWEEFLRADPSSAEDTLAEIVAFAIAFEAWGEHALGIFTSGVKRFFRDDLPRRRWREDTIQCARRRDEYHLSMVGAEILNRAWRDAFLGCERHVVVMPGCMRSRGDAECAAERTEGDLRCTGCTRGCAVLTATRAAERAGAEAVAVVHGSDFSRFLRSPAVRGGRTGIVGVACAPGLLGAGWRAYAAGFPAQCVLLESSGCEHWRDVARPTALDLRELERVLRAPL